MRARSSQIFAGLIPYNNGIDDDGPPPKYWKPLLQSYHERIDDSYYLSLGRGDVYADAMIQLQDSLEGWTRKLVTTMVHFTDDTREVRVRLFPTDGEESELPIFLHYDPKLLSRWKALFHAMAGNNSWSAFEVKNIEIPKVVMDEFTTALDVRATYFSDEYSLKFDCNNLDSESLARFLNDEVALRALGFINNNIVGHLPAICLPNHLRKMDLTGSGVGDVPICMSTLLSTCINLNELLLNNMPSGVAITEDCLGSNPSLQLLELESNHLNDNDAEVLASSLKTNTHLHTLSLGGNSFSKVAEDAFAKTICNDDDLNAVIDSNHTCTVYGVSEEIERLQCTVEEKKFRSIRHGYSFNDVPLELMPDVLAWLQSVPFNNNKVLPKALSLMFETLRSWNLPSLCVGRYQPEEVKTCLRDMISTVSNEEVMLGQSFHQASLPPRENSEYDTVIPNFWHGGLLITGCELGLDRRVVVSGYVRHADRSKGPTELFWCVKLGDIITAVNGISTINKSSIETYALLQKSNLTLPFVYLRLKNWKSFFRPLLGPAQTKYDNCYERSIIHQRWKGMVEDEYKLAQSQKDEVDNSPNPSRLQRLQKRTLVSKKNSMKHTEEKFLECERDRLVAWKNLWELKRYMTGLTHESIYQDCQCGRATSWACRDSKCPDSQRNSKPHQSKKQRTC